MHLTSLTRFQNDGDPGAVARADKVVVEAAHDEQCRHRGVGGTDVAVGNDQDIETIRNGLVCSGAERFEAFLETGATLIGGKESIESGGLETIERDLAEFGELFVIEQRVVQTDHAAAFRAGIEQVALGADEGFRGRDEFLADTIKSRVGYLCEDLLEVVIEMLRLLRKHGKRGVVAHR